MPTILPREERLFEQARLLPTASEREAFLTRACGADESLRAHLRSLLALHTQAESFFSEGASLLGHSPTVSEWRRHSLEVGKRGGGERQVGERIGRYKLIEPIGEGGCGIVYLAQQEEPVRRHVALKIIRVGMETSSVIQRFEAERQAIAMMDHPNIARIFDAGETDCGLPFFVMEYVRGVRLTDYCEEHRLSLRTRLELFIQVCHAIQHAHQNCIVHGDIKPSNILIAQHDGVALPKVIDFGISKATESRRPEKHPHVTVAQLVGTPAYMSPEQVEMGGLEIDTRSDIYSLGVLLYELLTSYTPLDGRALANASHEEVQRIFREHHPVPPSCLLQRLTPEVREHLATTRRLSPPRLGRLLQGDLDSIAMKALETDRRRRYETADAFAMDVRRHLANEPVMARPSSWVYRTGKLFRRNRGTFFATAMVMTALILGTSLSTWMFLREREARQRAVAAEQQQSRLRFEAETRESITQAALLVSQGRHAEADDLVRDLVLTESTLEGAAVFRSLGEWHALAARWRLAAERFETLLQIHHLESADVSSLDYLEYGPTLIESGQEEAYEAFRRDAIARHVGKQTPFADRIVKISLLRPADPATLASLDPLVRVSAELALQAKAQRDHFVYSWSAMSLALYAYRADDLERAVQWAESSLALGRENGPRVATLRTILAMTRYRLDDHSTARRELLAARSLIDEHDRHPLVRGSPVNGFWFDWALARILQREASALVEMPRAGEEPGATR